MPKATTAARMKIVKTPKSEGKRGPLKKRLQTRTEQYADDASKLAVRLERISRRATSPENVKALETAAKHVTTAAGELEKAKKSLETLPDTFVPAVRNPAPKVEEGGKVEIREKFRESYGSLGERKFVVSKVLSPKKVEVTAGEKVLIVSTRELQPVSAE
jgi:hypothetical protein